MDQFLRPGPGMFPQPRRAAHGTRASQKRHVRATHRRLFSRFPHRAPSDRGHSGRSVAGPRLRHRHCRQVASRPPARVSADPTRLRLLVRHPVLQRHGLAPSGGHGEPNCVLRAGNGLLARADHAERGGGRASGRPEHAHRPVRAGSGDLHRVAPGPAVLSVSAAHDAAHATVPVRAIRRAQHRRHLRGRHRRSRFGGWTGVGDAGTSGVGGQHPRGLHERQWPLDQFRDPWRVGWPTAARQGHDVRGRNASAGDLLVARDH